MPRLRFGTGSAILPLCLCEADFGQPKQSRRGPEIATHLSGARNARRGVEENRVDPFYLKKGGGSFMLPPFRIFIRSRRCQPSNLSTAGPGKSTWQSH